MSFWLTLHRLVGGGGSIGPPPSVFRESFRADFDAELAALHTYRLINLTPCDKILTSGHVRSPSYDVIAKPM